jgi:NAD(P)-dependent dehydrogenase (short-subunit alcohol dehydrogenase family)/acyl carrier protein
LSPESIREHVISVIAEVTRYPRDILLPGAHLEEELGIDSVKRAEVLAVLGSRFGIADRAEAAAVKHRTVGDVVRAVESYLQGSPPADTAKPVSPAPPPAAGPLLQRVVDVIAEATRCPRESLQPGADLEEDLGIDATQREAVFAALRRTLHLPFPERAPAVRTVGDVASVVRQLSPAGTAEGAPAQSAVTRQQAPAVRPLGATAPFAGKVALVTGSGHGIGKVIAAQLARLGATVAVNSFHSRQRGEDTTAEIVAGGGKAVHLWGSVANPAHLERVFAEIDSRLGGLDFLISNASNGVLAPLKDVTAEHWDRAFRTNVVALHQASLLAAERMRRRGGGRIVAISSNGSQRYLDYFGCMGPVKAAVECLVRYLAVELGPDNILVNAVSAGPVYGELLDRYPDRDRLRPRWEALVPRKRLNDEQEVAEAVQFLLTAAGLNGSVLAVDAGGGQRICGPVPEGRASP